MLPRSIRSMTLLLAELVTLLLFLHPTALWAQGPRAGVAPIELALAAETDERVRSEGRRAARVSRPARGAMIGMAIGGALGVGLGYLACSHETYAASITEP